MIMAGANVMKLVTIHDRVRETGKELCYFVM
uniref:Uncharacterized protein n=1 Tax=Rhizophora mucronata TaxID=61149 RepID=A0A2P2NXF0_RHIMU